MERNGHKDQDMAVQAARQSDLISRKLPFGSQAGIQGSVLTLGSPAVSIKEREWRFLFRIKLSSISFTLHTECVGELMRMVTYEVADTQTIPEMEIHSRAHLGRWNIDAMICRRENHVAFALKNCK